MENGNIFPTAGAPLSDTINEFLHICGINIVYGYGLSETTATVSCFDLTGYEFGTVGSLMPDIQVKLGENNEILVKGKTVMKGYYRKPEETARVFDLLLGDNLSGRKDYIAENGCRYLDMIDVS